MNRNETSQAGYEDVYRDGVADLIMHVNRAAMIQTGLSPETESPALAAGLADDRFNAGEDGVRPTL